MGPATAHTPPRAPLLALSLATLLAACGPAPDAAYAEPEQAPPTPAQTIYVVVGEQPEPHAPDAWAPEEPRGGNPFARTRTWVGDYDCPQGNTELTFRVLHVRGDAITAAFEFHHVDSGAAGKYLMTGRYDADTRKVRFAPGEWIDQPHDYVTVGMSGEIAFDGSLFAGRIDNPRCGAFRLRPAQ